MFDEWYAQPSFADPIPSASPKNHVSKPAHERIKSIVRSKEDERQSVSKTVLTDFERPVILRPRSTTDLPRPRNEFAQRENAQRQAQVSPELKLRVKQDLEARVQIDGIKDDTEFESYHNELQEELEIATAEKYTFFQDVNRSDSRTYLAVLQARLHSCNTILSQTSTLLFTLNKLKLGFSSVAEQTSAFQSHCDQLAEDEERLSHYADKLAENLQPFESLEPISRQLNAPGADFVTRPSFAQSLKRVDQSLNYFKQNSDFKDAELYEMRFRQCMTRALTLVRVYFVNSLKDIANDIKHRISTKAMNETTQSALLYSKFRSSAPPLKNVIREIEQRSHDHDEYASLLNECYQAYFGIRSRLMAPIIMTRMAEISGNKDLVSYCRSAFSFLRSVCKDEYELFFEFFPTGEKELYQYLLNLSEPLYDHVRPRIIHEAQIIALSELCLLFQTQFMRDPDEAETNFFENLQLDFGVLVQDALQDAQQRLVFRTENIVVNEIQNFVPKDRDLDYPRLLHVTSGTTPMSPSIRSPILSPTLSQLGGGNEFFDSGVLFQGWYPTLRKSIWILSKIYRLVNSAVFDDLAHQVVHLCILSLFNASGALATKKSQLDADLFLIKHLLILKEQVGAFDIEYVRPETEIDFSGVVDRFREFSKLESGMFSPTALRKVVQLPMVVENMLDAKVELDGKLRIAINRLTSITAEQITSTLESKNMIDTTEENIKLAAEKFREMAEKILPSVQQKTEEYIGDIRTSDILVNAVMEKVLSEYDTFYNGIEEKYGNAAKEIWDVHTLATWLNGLLAPRDGERNGDDEDDVVSNAGSEGRLERDFASP